MLLVAVTACSDGGNDPAAHGTTAPSTPAPPTSSATPPSESDIASEAASATLRHYFETVDLLRQDSKRPASHLDSVASSTELTAQANLLKGQRSRGLHQVGSTHVVEMNVQSVSLDDPAIVIIDVCWDVSGVDVVDQSGNSAVTPERKNVGWTRFTVTNKKWESTPTDGWRVSGGSDLEKQPCAGS